MCCATPRDTARATGHWRTTCAHWGLHVCPLKLGIVQQWLLSPRPVAPVSLAEHAGHSSLPVFQTPDTGLVLKVSVGNPRSLKTPPANGLPWALLSALPADRAHTTEPGVQIPWIYFHTSSSASQPKSSGPLYFMCVQLCPQHVYIDAGATSQQRATSDHVEACSFEHWHYGAVQIIRYAVGHWPQARNP